MLGSDEQKEAEIERLREELLVWIDHSAKQLDEIERLKAEIEHQLSNVDSLRIERERLHATLHWIARNGYALEQKGT